MIPKIAHFSYYCANNSHFKEQSKVCHERPLGRALSDHPHQPHHEEIHVRQTQVRQTQNDSLEQGNRAEHAQISEAVKVLQNLYK